MMKAVLCVPEELRESMVAFTDSESIPLNIVVDGECTVRVEQPEVRQESDLFTLQAGGWITCATGRAMASKLNLSTLSVGKLLNYLDIKVRKCELGCFK